MSFSQLYGYFEVDAKLPSGQGMWPAFWLLPENNTWPPELDVFEQLGKDPNKIYMTSHSEGAGKMTAVSQSVAVPNATTEFHTYGVLWSPTELVWYVDGKQVAETATPVDMHTPMYMLLDLNVGGAWGGGVTSATPSGHSLQINWVRAYSLTDLPVGEGNGRRRHQANRRRRPPRCPEWAGTPTISALDRSISVWRTGAVQAVISDFDGAGVWKRRQQRLALAGRVLSRLVDQVGPGSCAVQQVKYGVYDLHEPV